MTFTLHDYQLQGVDYLRARGRAGLFLDMGLGKTATALSALQPEHLPALVIAPKRVAETVWPPEKTIWRPELSLALAAGTPGERAAALSGSADIVVIGRDNVADVLGCGRVYRTVIIDELSSFKNWSSKRFKVMKQLTADPDTHVWGLTGTPAPNGYMDLWAQVYLLDRGERLGRNITAYRSRFFSPGAQGPNGVIYEWNLRDGAKEQIDNLIEDLCLAMKADGRIELPGVTYNNVRFQLPPAVMRVYQTLKEELLVDLVDLFDGQVHTAANAAALSSKLSQVTAGFVYEDEVLGDPDPETGEMRRINEGAYTDLHDVNVAALQEIIDGTGSPVLIFYRYTAQREKILAKIKGVRTIDEPGVIQDWTAGKVPVLLAHPASAGHGLNLQHGGNTIVWVSPTWDLEWWDQGNGRLNRQGQKNHVIIHVLLADHTLDHLIRATCDGKAVVQDSLMAHLESPL